MTQHDKRSTQDTGASPQQFDSFQLERLNPATLEWESVWGDGRERSNFERGLPPPIEMPLNLPPAQKIGSIDE